MSKTYLLAAAIVLMAGDAAFAQQAPQAGAPAQPQGPVSADLVPVEAEWTKVCTTDAQTKKELCYTARDFGAKADTPIMAFQVFDEKGSDQKLLRLLLPLGVQLRPGFRFAVDKGAFDSGNFEVCFPAGCFAETRIKASVVDGMKTGEKATIIVKNQANNEVTFYVPLAGFGKAYDGPPVDPRALEEQQRKLEEELQKKAEERERQQSQQTAAPSEQSQPRKK